MKTLERINTLIKLYGSDTKINSDDMTEIRNGEEFRVPLREMNTLRVEQTQVVVGEYTYTFLVKRKYLYIGTVINKKQKSAERNLKEILKSFREVCNNVQLPLSKLSDWFTHDLLLDGGARMPDGRTLTLVDLIGKYEDIIKSGLLPANFCSYITLSHNEAFRFSDCGVEFGFSNGEVRHFLTTHQTKLLLKERAVDFLFDSPVAGDLVVKAVASHFSSIDHDVLKYKGWSTRAYFDTNSNGKPSAVEVARMSGNTRKVYQKLISGNSLKEVKENPLAVFTDGKKEQMVQDNLDELSTLEESEIYRMVADWVNNEEFKTNPHGEVFIESMKDKFLSLYSEHGLAMSNGENYSVYTGVDGYWLVGNIDGKFQMKYNSYV